MLKRLWIWLGKPVGKTGVRPGFIGIYLAAAVWLGGQFAGYYVPHYGFTYLIGVGEETVSEFDWPAERDVVVYKHFRSPGYDAQFYAQLALDPTLKDPTLRETIDNLPYRARRILLPWCAYVFGFGQSNWVVNVFALQNLVCWFLLGLLLLRWFPPVDLDKTFRWLGIMLSVGVYFSVFAALVDGPSLLLLALALRWIEEGRTWQASAVLALSGLAKETNVLGVCALAPVDWRKPRAWLEGIGRGALVAAPLLGWFILLRWRFQDTGALAGVRNFDLPFVAFGRRWAELWSAFFSNTVAWKFLSTGLATHLSLTVQAIFLLGCWRWRSAAWRMTVPFVGLMFLIGAAVWEGYPGASSRVLLPMLLGFNLLVPKGRRWWLVLLLGNLTMFVSSSSIEPRTAEVYSVKLMNRRELPAAERAEDLAVEFPRPWYRAERSGNLNWRWSETTADIVLHNPYSVPLLVDIRGQWSAHTPRTGIVKQGDAVLWQQPLMRDPVDWRVVGVILPPGESRITIGSDQPAAQSNPSDSRRLDVRLRRFSIKARALVPELETTAQP